MEKEDAKKKPGRPKKQPVIIPTAVLGIVRDPVNKDDVMELVYCKPGLFSKLLRLYKQYAVSDVEMLFGPQGVKMITRDHIGKSKIYTTIDGNCMNLYYCKEPMRVCIRRDSLENVLSVLSRNHNRISIISKESNKRSIMYIIIKEGEYNSDEQYEVDVQYKAEYMNADTDAIDDDTDYPIKFCLSSKHFRSRINTIRKLSKTLIIQKSGLMPLQITFDKENKVNGAGVYSEADKISLVSTIMDGEEFSVSIPIDYIKPFSNSNIGDQIFISAHKYKKISFMTMIDQSDRGWACVVRIFTEIKNYRNDNGLIV